MWRRRSCPGAVAFAGLLLLIAEWSLTDGLLYSSSDLGSILFWDTTTYVGAVCVPVALLIFVVQYTGRNEWLKERNLLLLSVIPIVTLLVRLTNNFHHLFYASYGLVSSFGLIRLGYTFGVWFYVSCAYSYALLLIALTLLMKQMSLSKGVLRRQSLILLISILIPTAASLIDALNFVNYPFDWTPLASNFTGFGFFWAVFRFRLFELAPVAREEIVRNMEDGVIVLDAYDRLVDVNPAGERIFASGEEIVGKPVSVIFDNRGLSRDCLTKRSSEISLTLDGLQRYYDLTFTQLNNERGNCEGRIGVLRDITNLAASERRYRLLTENMADAIFTIDLQGKLTFASPQTEKMTGYKVQQLLTMNIRQLIAPEQLPGVLERLAARGRGETGLSPVQFDLIRQDSTRQPIEIHTKLLTDGNRPIGVQGVARDVSERKRMEDALRISESRFRDLANLLPQIIFEIDLNGNYTFVNRSGIAIAGYTLEDIRSGLNALQTFTEQDRPKIKNSIGRVLAGEDVGANEYTALRKDGTTFPVLIQSTRIIRDDVPVGLRGVAMDITERKQMENELRSVKDRLENLVASNPAVIYSGKPLPDLSDWALTYVSDRVVSVLGYSPQEVMSGVEFWRLHVHPDDLRASPGIVQELWRKGQLSYEYQFQHKDGEYRWIREEAIITRGEDGKPVEVNGCWVDITALKEAEEDIAASESKYRELFEASPVSLWEEDFSNVKRYFDELRAKGVSDLTTHLVDHPDDVAKCAAMVKVLHVNPATLELYGARSTEEMLGELRKVLSREAREQFTEELIAISEGKTRFTGEFSHQTLTGERKNVNLILNVLPGYEKTLGKVLVSIVDLTDRKKLEAQLLESQRLAAIGQTTAMVGHDLRNPLQAMTTSLYLAKLLVTSEKPEDRREALELLGSLDDTVRYMNKIVSDLQDYTRPVGTDKIEADLLNITKETLSNMQIPRNIEVTIDIEELLTVKLDTTIFQRILNNLVLNSLQAMPDGGKLTISGSSNNESFQVSVKDTGVGIPPEDLGKIFNLFFTTKAQGQGLGLPVCKRLVEEQGGTIKVNSQPGQGSVFTFKIPTGGIQAS